MKKISVVSASIFALLLVASPMALAAQTTNQSSDFNYQPLSVAAYVGPTITNPQAMPFCRSGLVCYSPDFIKSAYNYPNDLDGSGQTIVIVDAYGNPAMANDLAVFDQEFGIPAPPSFTVICPPGGCPNPSYGNKFGGGNPHGISSWLIETALDVEYAHAMAPGANIVLAVGMSSSGNAINVIESKVIPQYPGAIMSQSFGIPEALIHNNNAQVNQAEQNYQWANSLGWTLFAAAGDSGATNGFASANALFPSSDPYITSVGGTMGYPYLDFGSKSGCTGVCSAGLAFYDNSTGACAGVGPSLIFTCPPAGYDGEQVWNEPAFAEPSNLATGGGAPSLLFGVPSYQQGMSLASRTTPDVSYNAAINGGVLVYTSILGGFYIVGGTSAGSPQWAAIAALANQAAGHSLGFLNPTLYTIGNGANYGSDFHDITVGNNQAVTTPVGFSAVTGWDDASGWGTPNVANLVSDLSA